jgi:hypothetical protein
MSKHKWTREEINRLARFIEANRFFTVSLRGEQIGYIDEIPSDENCAVQVYHGPDNDPEAYDLGNGTWIDDYEPSDFTVEKLMEIDWQTCDIEKEIEEVLKQHE